VQLSLSSQYVFILFKAHENNFSGSLPAKIGQWTRIETFWVSSLATIFHGRQPSSQFCRRCTNQIHDNSFTGTLPETLSQWTALTDFDIAMNAFSGSLPEFIGASWSRIEKFTVSENMMIGTRLVVFGL
jgi:hypothetical protein